MPTSRASSIRPSSPSEFDPEAVAAGTLEVDDPYYGDATAFNRCLREVEAACAGLVRHLQAQDDLEPLS